MGSLLILPHHMLEYYSAMKRSEPLTLAAMWIELEHMVLSDGRQTQKAMQ